MWNRSNRKSSVLLETYNCCYVPIPKIPTSERIEAQLQRFYRHQSPKKESINTIVQISSKKGTHFFIRVNCRSGKILPCPSTVFFSFSLPKISCWKKQKEMEAILRPTNTKLLYFIIGPRLYNLWTYGIGITTSLKIHTATYHHTITSLLTRFIAPLIDPEGGPHF